MASYQEMESRLRTLESKIDFIMRSMRMRGMVPTGLLDSDGKPSYSTIEGSLLDFYREMTSKGLTLSTQSEAEPPASEVQ